MTFFTNTTMKQKVGWSLIFLSCVPWGLVFTIPWLPVPHPIVVAGILYGLSQVMWLVGLWCVGREALNSLKNWLVTQPIAQSMRFRFGKSKFRHSSVSKDMDP